MFLGYLLLVFLIIPAALVVAVVVSPVDARLWITFLVFPAGLTLYALWRHLRPGGRPQ